MYRNWLNRAALAAVIVFVASSAWAQTAATMYSSPADVLAARRAARERGDVAAELDCYSPSGQAASVKMIMTLIAATPTTSPTGQTDPEKAAFEAKYHLDQREQRPGESREEFADRMAAQLPDKRAFLLDFMTHQRAAMARRRAASTQPTPTKPVPQLEDLQVDPSGTSATGKLTSTDPDGRASWSQNVKFERVEGSWRIVSP